MQEKGFHEVQRLRHPAMVVLFVLLLGLLLMFLWACVQQIVFKIPFGGKPASNVFLIYNTVVLAGLWSALVFAKLDVRIDENGICYCWRLLQPRSRTIRWNEIDGLDMPDHGFVGYGIKLTKWGKIISMGSRKGLRLYLHSGERIIIDTRKPEELEQYIRQLKRGFFDNVFSGN